MVSILSQPRILIVDDEAFNLQLLRRLFENIYEVDEAKNGKLALELLENKEYDVVLLDIMMPEMNGLELLEYIRSSFDISELPIVLISALSQTSQVARGIQMGANDYITKPIDVDIVLARVNTQVQLKVLIDERQRMIARLQSANELKARMMQVASHDLKNPLNNLQLLTHIMARSLDNPQKMKKSFKMQSDTLDAMLSVIQDFLDSSIAQRGEISLNLQALNSALIIEQVLSQYAIVAYNKNIYLQAEQIEGIVRADKNRLLQVLGNLISNAIKYSPADSIVELFTEIDDEEQKWRLKIIDEGPGIPKNEQEYLFKPFSRDDISTQATDGESSTGLGLWIAYEMMWLQGGRIGMYNVDGAGACFWIELPLLADGMLEKP
jgi:two-component system, sensor histidine kinase and response regulator